MQLTSSSRRHARLIALGAAAAGMLLLAGCTVTKLRTSVALARQSEPLQHHVEAARVRLLIVGDSTAVGTGATTPERSLAGLLAAAYPGLHIENRGRDGATLAEVPNQLSRNEERFDIVLMLAGGNDVIRLRDLDNTPSHLDRIAQLAKARADTVVLMPAGNVGNAPFFFPPLSWWMASRSRQLHALVRDASQRQGVGYVSLFKERADDPFAQHEELNAQDGLHPSDGGYRVWFKELMGQSSLSQRLEAARS